MGFSVVLAFVINTYGFALAHSMALGILALLISPGIILVFIGDALNAMVFWSLFVAIDILYYELIYRFLSRR